MPVIRLYTDSPLSSGALIPCDEKQAHYLLQVMRLADGAALHLFNGRDGEWNSQLEIHGKKKAALAVRQQLRQHTASPDLWLACTPLKNSRTDKVLEKATELGVSRILPVTTRFTVVDKVNPERLHAIAVEAAEQSERLDVPVIASITSLEKLLGNWPKDRLLIYGDETGSGEPAFALLGALENAPLAVLVGPEGGFARAELELLRSLPFTRPISLGPRILRADTAAITLVALLQAVHGDWQQKPAFRNEENS